MGTTIVFLTFLVGNCLLPCMCEHGLQTDKIRREQFKELDESKGLIILGLLGTIAFTRTAKEQNEVTPPDYHFSYNTKNKLDRFHVKFRPGLTSFLKTLQMDFNLAIFSDKSAYGAGEVVKWLRSEWGVEVNQSVLDHNDLDKHSDGSYRKDVCGRGMDLNKIILVDHDLLMIYHRDNAINIKPYVIENINATDNVLYELLPVLSTKEFELRLASGGPLILKDSSSWLPNTPWQEAKNWIEGLAVTIRIEDSNLREVVKTKITQSNSKLEFALIPHQVKVRNSILRATSGQNQKLTLSDISFQVRYSGNKNNPDPQLMQATVSTVDGQLPTIIKCELVDPKVETPIDDLQDYEKVRNGWNDKELSKISPHIWKLGKQIWYGVETTIEIKSDWLRDPIKELFNSSSKTKDDFLIVVEAMKTRHQTFYKTQNPENYFRISVTDLILKISYKIDRRHLPGESTFTKYIEVVISPNNVVPPKLSQLTVSPNLIECIGKDSDLNDVAKILAEMKKLSFSSFLSGPIN